MKYLFLFVIAGLSCSSCLYAQSATGTANFREDTVSINPGSKGILRGSLIVPLNSSRFNVVLIIPGSGPTDRYGDNMMDKSNSYRSLATGLAVAHIGSLLIDKRGIAKSMTAMQSEANLRFDDYVKDVESWIAFLKTDKRIKHIVIAGHSEGSLVGMIAASEHYGDAYISIAGASQRIDQTIRPQLRSLPEPLRLKSDSIFAELAKGNRVDSVPPALLMLFRPSVQPYLISWMKFDPCAVLKQVTIPVMIIQGTTDLQVAPSEGEALSRCKPTASFHLISGMNHVLKDSPTDQQQNIATYRNPEIPVNSELVKNIIQFVKATDKY